MMTHQAEVGRIAAQVAAFGDCGAPIRMVKKSVSHFVPNPFRSSPKGPVLDLSGLDRLITLDQERRIAVAEPGLTFEKLVEATLPFGLAPYTVPELTGITIGGAVAGCSVESMSHRYGGFHDSCLEYELITGKGEVITCSPEKDPEIFHMLHGSYGTLGILSLLTFRLCEVKKAVRLDYHHFSDLDEFWAFLVARCQARDYDFVDAIIHDRRHLVACLGTMVDHTPWLSRYHLWPIYYKSTETRSLDYMSTRDYFFRYDAECHWLSRSVPPLENPIVRLLAGRFFLGSTNMIRWANRLAPIFRMKRRPDVVVDVFIPARNFKRFFEWYVDTFDFWPLWLVPYHMEEVYPWVDDAFQRRIGEQLVIDCAIYGKPNDRPDQDLSELLERKVYELDGIKTLISRNHYDRTTFWSIYSKPRYEAVKALTDPRNLFQNTYEMLHPERR